MATKPFEIIVAPFEAYVAATGTAFPAIDATPGAGWTLIGKNGKENMAEGGVTVEHQQTVDLHRVYGALAPVKATRSQQALIVRFTLFDLLLAEYARVLNDNAVTTVAAGGGAAGHKAVDLALAITVSEKAYLIRGKDASPEGDGWNTQYEIWRAVITSSPSVVFAKNAPAGLQFDITVLFDTAQAAGKEMGVLRVQHQTAV